METTLKSSKQLPTPLSEQTCASTSVMYQNTDCDSTQPTISERSRKTLCRVSQGPGLPNTIDTLMESDTSKSDEEIMDTWWQLLTETGYDLSSNEALLFGNESASDQTRWQTNGKEPSQTTQNFGFFTYPSSTSLTTATNDWILGTISSIPSPEMALSNLNATCEKLWTYGET